MKHWEYEELAALLISGGDSDKADEIINNEDVDSVLYEKFGFDFDQFMAVADELIKFTPLVESPMTGKVFHAFVCNGVAVVKEEAK